MWVLENEGDVLQGKRLWLRPGKKFLFGRTQLDIGGQFVVSDKTISRQHLTVEVDAVTSSDCPNLRSRSRVTLTDLNTKIGTLVNGEQIRGQSYVLEKGENEVQLGRYKYHFRFTWVPLTFTFSFTAKEQRADPYTKIYEQLGPLDIKVLIEYEPGITTHLVAKKRNTSKGLQALIDGKFIVKFGTFVEAVVAATTAGAEGPSPLEEDFDANFPNALEYLPEKGEEPTQRAADAYAPDPTRHNMFEGYTFVFYDKRQFETLLAPITEGCGKALFQEAIPNKTTVNEFVRYVKSVAGEKGLGEFEDGSEGKGVVVVRFNPVKGVGTEWFADFSRQVALYLDHRLIEQNEFLDAILGSDASVLRRPLEVEASGVLAPQPTTTTLMSSQTLQSSKQAPAPAPSNIAPPEPPEPIRRGRSRRTAPRFRGFDDDFEASNPALSSVQESVVANATPVVESQSQSLFVSQGPEINFDQELSQPSEAQISISRKRPAQLIEEEEDIMISMAPATTALKRRRLAEDTARKRRGEPTPPPASVAKEKVVPKDPPKAKKARPEIDVLEVARRQREKAEDLARAEREALERDLDALDIQAVRDSTVIEEFEVSRAQPAPRAARADDSERWVDKWNGRKNFKKFRRRGADGENAKGPQKVIVQLEEVKKKDFGIGDDYWLESTKDNRRKRKKGKEIETQDETRSQPKSRGKNSAAETAAEILMSEVEDRLNKEEQSVASSSEVEIVEEPTRLAPRSQRSHNLPATNKRAAPTTLTKPAPAKKARQTLIRKPESDEDSDDELKFRFGKRK